MTFFYYLNADNVLYTIVAYRMYYTIILQYVDQTLTNFNIIVSVCNFK